MKIKCFFEINKIKLLDVWEGADLRALYYILLVLTLYLLLMVLTVLMETYKVTEGVSVLPHYKVFRAKELFVLMTSSPPFLMDAAGNQRKNQCVQDMKR